MKRVGSVLAIVVLMVMWGCSACEQTTKKGPVVPQEPATVQSDPTCFDQCMARNQMRATAIEMIEANCRKTCVETP
jgi:PBP1b-binding outer membrane lipoprotein LpoB